MKRGTCALIFVSVLALSGCTTTLKREQIQVGQHPAEPGFQYFLPAQRFTVTAIFRLESCPDANGDAEAVARPLIIKQTASAVEISVPDPAEFHSIPLSAMTSSWKTTTFTGTLFENQVLRSVGITVDDRSGAVIKSALGVATSVARVMIGAPVAFTKSSLCHPEIYRALDTVRSSRAKLLDPSLDEKARAAIVAAVLSAKAELEITKTYVFVPAKAELKVTHNLKDAVLKWFADPSLTAHTVNKPLYDRNITTGIQVVAPQMGDLSIVDDLRTKGVIYREPVPATLKICAGDCGASNSEVLATLQTQVAQLGRYVVIPLENGPFQKNNLSLAFLQNGQLETVTYGNESTLEKIAGSAAESATAIEGYLAKKKAVDDAGDTKMAGAELKAIKDETELMKAKADRIEQARRLLELSGDL